MSWLEKLRAVAGKLRTQVWRLRGQERHSGAELTLLYAGEASGKSYLAKLAYRDGYEEVDLGRMWLWRARTLSRESDSPLDASFLQLNQRLLPWAGSYDYCIPAWVPGAAAFADVRLKLETSQHLKADLRRIRKHGYSPEISHDLAEFRNFYHRMYRPHTLLAHGESALLHSEQAVMERAARSELLLLRQGAEVVAGEIIVYQGDDAIFWCNGVLDGNRDLIKAGALAALYYYRYQHLQARGYHSVHMGTSRPFLKDGVLQYKKKWGMHLSENHYPRICLRINRLSPGLQAFLLNNPFLHEVDGQWHAAVFIESTQGMDEAGIRNIYRDLVIPGTSKLVLQHCTATPEPVTIPAELAGKVEIRPAVFSSQARRAGTIKQDVP